MGKAVQVIHLNLLSPVGRQAAGRFGVKIVPATVLLNNVGEVVYRRNGMPDRERLAAKIRA
jgi:hypothetical protein